MKGEFFVHQIDDEIYSTNSLFWACFFTDKRIPGAEKQKELTDKDKEKTNWDIVTHNGKIIHRFGGSNEKNKRY